MVTKKTGKKISVLRIKTITGNDHDQLKNAKTVFDHTIKSVNKFYAIYQRERQGSSGSTTHEEQDLLRAILVFSCSGLDAVIKQLIKDALPKIIQKDIGAEKEFQKFVERSLRKTSLDEKDKITMDIELLAKLFINDKPKELLILRLTRRLTDDSLQNRDQLLKVAAHFAITSDQVLSNTDVTKEAFDARNEIIHEMDINFDSTGSGLKKRRQRSKEKVIKQSENILSVAAQFINATSIKLD